MLPLILRERAAEAPVTVPLRILKLYSAPHYRRLQQKITEFEPVETYRANVLHDAHHEDSESDIRS